MTKEKLLEICGQLYCRSMYTDEAMMELEPLLDEISELKKKVSDLEVQIDLLENGSSQKTKA